MWVGSHHLFPYFSEQHSFNATKKSGKSAGNSATFIKAWKGIFLKNLADFGSIADTISNKL